VTSNKQLAKWVNGESIHRDGSDGGECCPDFSCCRPDLLVPANERQLFANSSSDVRYSLLMGYLSKALADKKVYITSEDTWPKH